MNEASVSTDRKVGKVIEIDNEKKGYGFINTEDIPNQRIYFKTKYVQGPSPLEEGDKVTFQLKRFEEKGKVKFAAFYPKKYGDWDYLFDWAFLGHLPNALTELKTLALKERWRFKNSPQDQEHPFPILFSYLVHTFGRLHAEQKIMVNKEQSLAAFNTGLVDNRYEAIFALFEPNKEHNRSPWKLKGFCISGEDENGQKLVRNFNPLPATAHYFDDIRDLLYDVRAGAPEGIGRRHIIIQNIRRFPGQFIEDHCPPGFTSQETSGMTDDQRNSYFTELGRAVDADDRTYRAYKNRLKDAIDLSIKRIRWNFKTAIPQYYPRVRKLNLLLPICLVSDDRVDMALAVEKTESGNYLAHTILPLNWAYKNARLICRPDSDWLIPQEIIEGTEEQAED